MTIKFKIPIFENGKKERQYFKSIIREIDQKYNQHVADLGDWPLVIRFLDDEQSNIYSLFLRKELEPDENPTNTMEDIIAFVRQHLKLDICNIECSEVGYE